MHLRMTGTLLLDPAQPPRTRACGWLDGDAHAPASSTPAGSARVSWCRRGPLETFLASRARHRAIRRGFTAELLRTLARGRRAPIKAFLLDQRKVAGVGNIYADEALFRAGMHPLARRRLAWPEQYALLRDAVRDVLAAGIDAKGASIDDFRHLDGARGSFQDRFLVHRRADEPCPDCGGEISKITVGGRGTYLCRHCQPIPRRGRK